MTTGHVASDGIHLQAVIEIGILGTGGRSLRLDAVIDAGFTDFITLPAHAIQALGLSRKQGTLVQLADDRSVTFATFTALAELDGRTLPVDVYQADVDPLIGMALLKGFHLSIHVTSGGEVTVEKA